jgi:hypothetical protein
MPTDPKTRPAAKAAAFNRNIFPRVLAARNPITGIARCCARAANGTPRHPARR